MHLATSGVVDASQAGLLSVRPVAAGVLRPVSLETLGRWFNWANTDEGLLAAREALLQQQGQSVFVRPTIRFVSREKCDWAKNKEATDEFTAATPERMIAHPFAREQRACAHAARVKRGGAWPAFNNVAEFWEAMHR